MQKWEKDITQEIVVIRKLKMKKKILTGSIFLAALFLQQAHAQDVEFKSSNFKDKKEEFKSIEEGLEKAEPFYQAGFDLVFNVKDPGMNFKQALNYYEKAQEFNPNSALNNFHLGICYYYSSEPYKAIAYILKAKELNPECDPFLYFYLGAVYQLEEKFNEAIEAYKYFENDYKKADDFTKFVTQRKRECAYAKERKANPERVWVDNLTTINTAYDEIAPSITTDGSQIIYSSNKPNGHTPDEVGEYDMDIYYTDFEDGSWNTPKPLPGAVNTPNDEVVNNLYYDGTKLLLHRELDGQTDIFESFLNGANWMNANQLPVQISSDRNNEKYASYNFDGYKIYFGREVASRSNGYDIMFSGLKSKINGDYGAAANVSTVNSKFNDGPIYLAIDGETMYIASQGHGSIGGYDIFVSYKKQGTWSKPENMGYPINTPYDDFFFANTANGKFAYIASNRAGGKGGFDLYKVTFWGAPKEPAFDMEDYLLASVASPIKDPQIANTVEVNKTSLTVFKGKTIDALTGKAVEAEIDIIDNETGKVIEQFTTNSATGKFLLSLQAGKNYGISVKAEGYLFHSENFDIPNGSAYQLVNKIIELKNIAVGSKIALRNIFFDVGKANLRATSNTELDRLVKLLKDVPSLKIEISGHTDNTGSSSINDQLSQDRAQAVVDYLVNHGIAKDRITAKGYGSTRPIASNNTASGRQENRRTEFEIIEN